MNWIYSQKEWRPATVLGNWQKDLIQEDCFLINRKHCKKALLNKKKLSSIDNNEFNFNSETKPYINKYLTPINESISFHCRKLKRSNIIYACYTREGIVHIFDMHRGKQNAIENFPHVWAVYAFFRFCLCW